MGFEFCFQSSVFMNQMKTTTATKTLRFGKWEYSILKCFQIKFTLRNFVERKDSSYMHQFWYSFPFKYIFISIWVRTYNCYKAVAPEAYFLSFVIFMDCFLLFFGFILSERLSFNFYSKICLVYEVFLMETFKSMYINIVKFDYN